MTAYVIRRTVGDTTKYYTYLKSGAGGVFTPFLQDALASTHIENAKTLRVKLGKPTDEIVELELIEKGVVD